MDAGLEVEGSLKGACSARYGYGAFILLFLIVLAGFYVKTLPLGSSAAALPKDSAAYAPGLTGAGHFIMSGRIDINTADVEGLSLLPGIGRGIATKIIEQRAAFGGFSSVEELLGVDGIGERRLASIRAFLSSERRGYQ